MFSKTPLKVHLLDEVCPHCGAKVYRFKIDSRCPADDNGGEFCCTTIEDQCVDDCQNGRCVRSSGLIKWPLEDLNAAFGQYASFQITTEEFNQCILAALQRFGATMKIVQAS